MAGDALSGPESGDQSSVVFRWVKVESGQGRKRHTVYWNCPLPDGKRLTVARIYDGPPDRLGSPTYTPGGPWRWRIYSTKRTPSGKADVLHEGGIVPTPQAGKRAAEAAYNGGPAS